MITAVLTFKNICYGPTKNRLYHWKRNRNKNCDIRNCVISKNAIYILLLFSFVKSNIAVVTNAEDQPILHHDPFQYKTEVNNVANNENSTTDNVSETFKEAEVFHSFLQQFQLDFISPLNKEDVFISMKDDFPADVVEIVDGNKVVIYQSVSNYTSKYIIPKHSSYKRIASSSVKGIPIYVNYGRHEDYDLKRFKGIALTNHIAVIRLGKISIQHKVEIAFSRGVSGVLLFADPHDFTEDDILNVHHEIIPIVLGKLQQRYSNLQEVNSINEEDQLYSKSIPVQIISASVAMRILNEISPALSSPNEWKGSMNISYFPGPGFIKDGWSILMQTHCVNVRYENYDLVATITGKEEPDRYVIVGSHRQPMKTAQHGLEKITVLMEMAKTLSELKRNGGWIPRRSIVFFSWGLEGVEYYSSVKWMEQHRQILAERAVAYIHINNPVLGTRRMKVETTPPLHDLIIDVASAIRNPNELEVSLGKMKIADTWNNVGSSYEEKIKPKFEMVQDYWYLTFRVPAVSVYYVNDIQSHTSDGDYVDDNSTSSYKEAVMYVLISIAYRLSDSELLPYKLTNYPDTFNRSLTNIYTAYKSQIQQPDISLQFDKLRNKLNKFSELVESFDEDNDHIDEIEELNLRITNDQMMNVNKLLLCTEECYNRPILLSEGDNGLALGPIQDALLSERLSKSKSAVFSALKNATLCLSQANSVIDTNFL